MIHKAQSGYILLLTTFIIATIITLISFVVSRVATYRQLTKLTTEKCSARLIARSGIAIAMSQLLTATSEKAEKTEKASSPNEARTETKEQEDKTKEDAIDFVLKKLNTWQKFDLTEEHDGIEATCKVYITAEQGKINLNNLYDFGQKKFKVIGTTDGKKILEFLTERLKPIFEAKGKKVDLVFLVEQAFQQNNAPLDDISQIIPTKGGEVLYDQLFPSEDHKDAITLFDIFTTAKTQGMHPLAFTPSIKLITGCKKLDKNAKEKPTNDQVGNILNKQITNWSVEWEPTLSLLYGITYQAFPESIKSLFANKFGTDLFFVVSYGKVGSITEKVAALIERNKSGTIKDKPFVIRKLYWL